MFGRKTAPPTGWVIACVQVKSVDYYRQQIDLVTINSERQTNREDTQVNLSIDELSPDPILS